MKSLSILTIKTKSGLSDPTTWDLFEKLSLEKVLESPLFLRS